MKQKNNAVPIVSITQLEKLIEIAVHANQPVLITGAPGIGKTASPVALTIRKNWPLMIMHPVVMDPTDAKGMPAIVQSGRAHV